MKSSLSKTLVVALAFGLIASPGSAAEKPASSPNAGGIEQATARLAKLDLDLHGLWGRIEASLKSTPAPPPDIAEELGRVRPRVREAVSLVFGLHWSQAEPVLQAAHAIEKRVAELEERLRKWSVPARNPVRPIASPVATGAMTGIVTDEATGNPLANVIVHVTYWLQSAPSDSSGRWTVTGLETGTYFAYTTAPAGYANEVYRNVPCVANCYPDAGTRIAVIDGAVTSGVDFSLAKNGSISGTVTDLSTGLGVSQVQVRLSKDSETALLWVTTNADGTYSFPQVSPGSYRLRTDHSRYLDQLYDGIPCEGSCDVSTGAPVVVVPSANTPGIDFALQRGGSVSGKVTSAATGAPVTSGIVRLDDASGESRSAGIDASGSYRFDGLTAGTYFAKAESYGWYADQLYDGILCEPTCTMTTGTPIVLSSGEERDDIDFPLVAFGAFQGRVADSVTGFPLPNTSVTTYASDGSLWSYDYTDAYGDYDSGGLLDGTYFAVARSTTHFDELYDDGLCQPSCDPTTGTPIPVSIGSTTSPIDFSLDRAGGIMGTVTAAVSGGGFDYFYFTVDVYDSSGVSTGSVSTNSEGEFVLRDLAAGTYFARARRPWTHLGQLYSGIPCEPSCIVTTGTPIPVTSGTMTPGVNFTLRSYGALSGTVKAEATGQALEYAYVNVYDATGAYVGYASTGINGTYKITGLLAGSYFAMAAKADFVPQLHNGIPCVEPCAVTSGTPISVELDSEATGIDFALVVPGTSGLRGTITDTETGLPLASRSVSIHDATGAFVTDATTDGAGEYRLAGLPPGSYFVSTTGSTDYVDELWSNLDCGAPCDVTKGTPVVVALGGVTAGIDFRLHKPYFADVGLGHWARRYIEGAYVGGVTSGCGTSPLAYCPEVVVNRWQMAVFLARAIAGSDAAVPSSGTVPSAGPYDCVAGGVSLFPNDVPPTDGGCRHIHYIYGKGVTSGCGPGSFCPGGDTTRWQTAVFMAIALAGSNAAVPVSGTIPGVGDYDCVAGGTTLFPNDVPATDGACRHVHYIYGQGLTAGCGPGSFCPSSTLSRDQMAVFLAKGFHLTKYGP